MGYVVAVCVSSGKGMRKKNVGTGRLVAEHGLEGDAHAGPWHCAIYHQAGDCVMPKEGIFIKVLNGGQVRVGDEVRGIGE